MKTAGFGDLTEHAVRKAMAEFDERGRNDFLKHHRFGRTGLHFIVDQGRRYDAHAIAAVAYGYRFPETGPLKVRGFRSGPAMRTRLAQLDFTIEPGNPAYWVLVCNPKKWAIDRFLAERIECDTWGVRPSDRQDFAPGQLALVRVGIDHRTSAERQGRPRLESGIYALCEVESTASPGTGAADRFWAPGEARSGGWPTISVRYLRTYVERPLTIARLKTEKPYLSSLLLDGFQASSFPIGETDFRAILDMLGEDRLALPGPPISPPGSLEELANLEERYLSAAPEVRERISKVIERGPVGAWVKCHNGYRCQICEALGRESLGFTKTDGKPYVEAHHVVPVSRLGVGTLAAGNIITVCANHHRQLHYGMVGVKIKTEIFRFDLPEGSIEISRFTNKRSTDFS